MGEKSMTYYTCCFAVNITSPHDISNKQQTNISEHLRKSCEDYLNRNAELGLVVKVIQLGSFKEKGNKEEKIKKYGGIAKIVIEDEK